MSAPTSFDSDLPSDHPTPLLSSSSLHQSSISSLRLNRPVSIGDASQLFGGGGSDDFFGPSSAAFIDPITTSNSSSTPPLHSSSSLPPHPIHAAPPPPPPPFDPPFNPSSYHQTPPSTHHHHHHPPPPPPPIPNPPIYPSSSHPPSRLSTPLAHSSYAQSNHRHPSSSPLPAFDHHPAQQSSDPYNPYLPSIESHPTHPNKPSYSPAPAHPPSLGRGPTHLYRPDLIPRSASVNALPSPSDSILHSQDSLHSSFHPSNLAQPPPNQSANSALNRPKVYDAYDPPAIRKKKPHAFNTTTSLPASPAIGTAHFYPQPIPFTQHPPSQLHPSSIVPPPPPPTKQRSTSTPAQTQEPVLLTSIDPNDSYVQDSQFYHHHHRFVPSSYPNHPSNSSHPINPSSTLNLDPYVPANLSPSDLYPSSQEIISTHPLTDPYRSSPSHPHGLDGSSRHLTSQLSHTTYLPTNPQSTDPYAPVHRSHQPDHPVPSHILLADQHPSEPSYSYNRNANLPASDQNLGARDGNSSPYADRIGSSLSSQSRIKSPIESAGLSHQPVDGNLQPASSLSNHPKYSSSSPLQDPIDALNSATQNLSLNSKLESASRSFVESNQSNLFSSIQTPTKSLDIDSSLTLATPSDLSQNLMAVPDVQILPATPQIPKIDPHEVPPASQFDVLADLSSGSHQERSQGGDSSTFDKSSSSHADYGISTDLDPHQPTDPSSYPTEYDYRPVDAHNPYDLQPSKPALNSIEQPSDGLQSYDPYSLPHDPNRPGSGSHLGRFTNNDQLTPFVNPDSHDLQIQSSDYNLMGETSEYGNGRTASQSLYSDLQPENLTFDQPTSSSYDPPAQWMQVSHTDDLVPKASLYNPYDPAPEQQKNYDHPNLHENEDPMLERLKHKVPIATFGFGGKLVTILPASPAGITTDPTPSGDEDPYGPVGTFTSHAHVGRTMTIQQLSQVIPSTDLQSFPGPLFMDGGNNSKSNLGKKRKEVMNWLDAKLDESEKELVFIQSTLVVAHNLPDNEPNRKDFSQVHHLQDKIVLLKLLKLLVENEAKLAGTPKVEEAVRLVLQSFSGSASTLETSSALLNLPLGSNSIDSNITQDVVSAYTTRSSHLDSIQTFLSHGDRQKAIQVAIEHKMWPHALIIANSLGNDVWRDTVKEFVRFELSCDGDHSTSNGTLNSGPHPIGRESLRTLYTLFAGAGPAAVDEFSLSSAVPSPSSTFSESNAAPNMAIGVLNGQLGPSRIASPIPLPHQARPSSIKIPNDVLQQWRSVVAMTVANRVPGSSPFLLRLGDTLLSHGRVYAAHITYLLSNGLMPQLGLENGNRICLLGTPITSSPDRPRLDVEAVMLTEVLEFALSLSPVPKSSDPFIGLPHLQAYRLALGVECATFGLVEKANRYCEALASTLKLATKPCHFYHATLFEQVKALSARLSATPAADKSTSWITRKMPRPTLDNVWQTLEGRVHKFVAGDDDEGNSQSVANSTSSTSQNNQVLGPFSHFSSISPGSASAAISRVQSSSDLGYSNNHLGGGVGLGGPFAHNTTNPRRPSSGAGFSSSTSNQAARKGSLSNPYDGSTLSPIGYSTSFRSQTSSVPPLQNYDSSSLGTSPINQTVPSSVETITGESNPTAASSGGGWWEASNSYGTPVNSTAAQPVFESIEDTPIADDGSGFIDPMASFGGVPSFASPGFPTASHNSYDHSSASRSSYPKEEAEAFEDLGFGNSSSRKRNQDRDESDDHPADDPSSNKTPADDQVDPKSVGTTSDSEKNKSVKPAPSTSWLGRWFKRDSNISPQGSGPVKANLGEDFSLVYDPETKRWINKKAGSSQTSTSSGPPPPPPRAQTASPTSSMRSSLVPLSSTPSSTLRNSSTNPSSMVPGPPPISRSSTTGPSKARASLDVPPTFSPLTKQDDPNDDQAPLLPPSSLLPSSASPSGIPPPPATFNNPSKKPNTKKNIRSRYVEIR